MKFEYLTLSNILGLFGVVLILTAYFLLQLGKLKSTSQLFLWMNISGSLLLLFSLYFDFNLPSVIIEFAWLSISVMGLIRMKFNKMEDQ